MWTRIWAWLGIVGLPFFFGCSTMCQGPDDCSYSAIGGSWQRTDFQYGRVGSAFTPEVGSRVAEMPADSQMPVEAELPSPKQVESQPQRSQSDVPPRAKMQLEELQGDEAPVLETPTTDPRLNE